MLKAGQCDRPAEVVASRLLALGATNLQAKLGKEIASIGGQDWRTDTTLRELLRRWDGRPYHRESIGRARRLMARRGWLGVRRIFAAQPLPSLPGHRVYKSSHGTTNKTICWAALGVSNPLKKREQRDARRAAENDERKKHDEPITIRRRTSIPAVEAFLEDTDPVDEAPRRPRRTIERPVDREHEHQSEIEERAAQARRDLEAWARENEGRGPPE